VRSLYNCKKIMKGKKKSYVWNLDSNV
jgi:hypothetical protein